MQMLVEFYCPIAVRHAVPEFRKPGNGRLEAVASRSNNQSIVEQASRRSIGPDNRHHFALSIERVDAAGMEGYVRHREQLAQRRHHRVRMRFVETRPDNE